MKISDGLIKETRKSNNKITENCKLLKHGVGKRQLFNLLSKVEQDRIDAFLQHLHRPKQNFI
jgi:hypothetical protein